MDGWEWWRAGGRAGRRAGGWAGGLAGGWVGGWVSGLGSWRTCRSTYQHLRAKLVPKTERAVVLDTQARFIPT